MGVAEKVGTDYEHCERVLRRVLATPECGGDNPLAEIMHTGRDKSLLQGGNRRSRHETHATETRRRGGSKALISDKDYADSAFVHAIHALPEPYPAILRGRYHPNPTMAEKFSVVHPVLGMYRKSNAMLVAKDMIDHIYSPRMVRDEKGLRPQKIWERYEYTSEEWMNTDVRKAWDRLRKRVHEHVNPAIDAWVAECDRRGLVV